MTSGRFRHLPLVDDSGVIGMVDITDVCRALLDIGLPGPRGVGRGSRGTGGAGHRGPASLPGMRRLWP
jgi:CBS domain-containing protein